MNNPCNSRTMSDYLRDIRIIADELAIAGQPVPDDDLVILTLSGLGDEFRNIKYALSVRHDTKVCRQLSHFLRDNGIQTASQASNASPTVNATLVHTSHPQQWLFDTGASHHITSDPSNLTTYSDYAGPEEIVLGNGSVPRYGGYSTSRGEQK
ncbi:hypothetical protein AgCh_029454 [Apium graveolens]